MANEQLTSQDLVYYPNVAKAIDAFLSTIEGPFLLRVPALVRRGKFWVECEAVVYRGADGVLGYEAHPMPFARTMPVDKFRVATIRPPAETKAPADPEVFTGGQFQNYKERDVASPLQTKGNRLGSMDLVVDEFDDMSDAPEPVTPQSGQDLTPKASDAPAASHGTGKEQRSARRPSRRKAK